MDRLIIELIMHALLFIAAVTIGISLIISNDFVQAGAAFISGFCWLVLTVLSIIDIKKYSVEQKNTSK